MADKALLQKVRDLSIMLFSMLPVSESLPDISSTFSSFKYLQSSPEIDDYRTRNRSCFLIDDQILEVRGMRILVLPSCPLFVFPDASRSLAPPNHETLNR